MAAIKHTLTIPSSTRYLEDVRQFVATHAAAAEFSDSVVEELKIAVDEACTNVIKHAYQGEGEHAVDIDIIITKDKLTVKIRDIGRAFNQKDYSEPNLIEYAKSRKAGGLGVHLMRRLMDRVEFRTRGNVNECCLVKYRDGS